jgi:hypothetical protein
LQRAREIECFASIASPPQYEAGKTPDAWQRNPAKNRRKDKDARWTKKHGKSFFGYKNHVK